MGKTFGIVSLLLAIVSIILLVVLWNMPVIDFQTAIMLITIVPVIILLLSLIGMIMGIVGIKKDDGSALAIVGMILNICMLICSLLFVFVIAAIMSGAAST